MTSQKLPKIIVIIGTNASGKSSLGIKLAQQYDGEIISADSRQVYKGFDLCCGKVDETEQRLVKHYMLDICDIGENYSVSDYQQQVYDIIPKILAKNKVPFIVGGTGLYISSLVYGYEFLKEDRDDSYRFELEAKTLQELQSMLPIEGTEILRNNNSDYNNKRRVIRALEKIKYGDKLFSENVSRYDTLQLGITWPKEILDKRIEDRLSLRVEQGMIDEVKQYIEAGNNPDYLLKLGLEYRYITWYVQGKYSSYDEFYDNMARAIKRFAKKQLAWFKRDKSIHWLNMEGEYFVEASSLIDAFLSNRPE